MSNGQHEDDRRKFDRLERRDSIMIKEFSYPERENYTEARILDISGGGLQIECKRLFDVGSTVKIEMNFTGWQRYTSGFLKHFGGAASRPLVVLAEVIRSHVVVSGRKYEAALIFTGIDQSHQQALIRFIRNEILKKRQSPDPAEKH